MKVIIACSDLMTSSRLELSEGVDAVVARKEQDVMNALADFPNATLVVDLLSFPELLRNLKNDGVTLVGGSVAFAPHVHEELLANSRNFADVVVPRGAVVKRLAAYADEALNSVNASM